jgi:hypothetical protein
MAATSLTGRRLLDDVHASVPLIETRLALGVPVQEALRPVVRNAARSGLIPALDQTKNVCLVTLPGTFVGLVLGGADPAEAAPVQLTVLLSLLGSRRWRPSPARCSSPARASAPTSAWRLAADGQEAGGSPSRFSMPRRAQPRRTQATSGWPGRRRRAHRAHRARLGRWRRTGRHTGAGFGKRWLARRADLEAASAPGVSTGPSPAGQAEPVREPRLESHLSALPPVSLVARVPETVLAPEGRPPAGSALPRRPAWCPEGGIQRGQVGGPGCADPPGRTADLLRQGRRSAHSRPLHARGPTRQGAPDFSR